MSAALRCEALVDLLVDYFGDALDASARQTLRDHCAVCPDCDNYVRTYAATLRLTARVLRRTLSPAERAELEARLPNTDPDARG